MDPKQFKKDNRMAACTVPPWAQFIPYAERDTTLRQIREETLEAYGYGMDDCPKRMVCLKKECLGRQLPWKSETAKPYLEQLKATQAVVNGDLFITTNCSTCPIVAKCTSLCNQVSDFVERDKTKEPKLQFNNNVDVTLEDNSDNFILNLPNIDVPWDALNELRRLVVKNYLYEQKDFKHVANTLGLANQATAKYEFYAAMTTLSEFTAMRRLLSILKGEEEEIIHCLYVECFTQAQLAAVMKVSKQAVSKRVKNIITKHKVKWPVFVRKHKNKLIYNVPQLFK